MTDHPDHDHPHTDHREQDVIRAFVGLSHELVDDYDVLEMLAQLTRSCADLLDVSSAGLLLADGQGVLHLAATSSESTRHLEVFQLQRDQGPCLDCYRTGQTVVAEDRDEMRRHWPEFARAAELVGFESVHALPMRLRDHALGTVGLFGEHPGRLGQDDLDLAQALVHVASVAIVNERSALDRDAVNDQLQHALTSRIVLEQAKGVVAAAGELDMEDAFHVLRRYARDHGRRLSDVAAEVVGRRLRGPVVLAHAREVGILPH
ncbi:GAF and ANTAR domain-containing protein [Nocardioides aurantiacus]|uniref:Response regulator receiver and ANTAR domain protein n=1 Tax=Nocardioides aurantiacus TaxID=86796 RepID=A0A3N2CWG8_9ACTN|nr:GAF and ANTAR domain-containing protein [Nocardioides aurantiacus]ROR91881.1 response regulator receiver and ANTAR domain protein [Nocardioides aurantiacus]